MKENVFKAVFAAALAGLSAYFSVLLIPLLILLVVMILDYATGMAKAWLAGTLSSKTGFRGIIKKLAYFGIVAAAMVADWIIRCGLEQLGVAISFEFFLALLVVVWLIINELISILENLAEIGAPKIPFLSRVLEHLKNTVDKKAGDLPGGKDET